MLQFILFMTPNYCYAASGEWLVVAGHSSSVLDAVHVIAQIAHFEWDKPEVAAAAAGGAMARVQAPPYKNCSAVQPSGGLLKAECRTVAESVANYCPYN